MIDIKYVFPQFQEENSQFKEQNKLSPVCDCDKANFISTFQMLT